MLPILLILIFIRPFISSLAFPCLNVVYSIALAIFLSAYVFYKKSAFPQTIIYPVILFFAALFMSVLFSQNKLNSLPEVNSYIAGLLLFFVVVSLSEKRRALVIKTIILSGLAVSFLAIYQYFFGFKHVSNYLSSHELSFPFALDCLQRRRVFLPFIIPNTLGGYLAMVVPLAMVNKTWFILPIFFALLLTKSLGALLALFCGVIIYFYGRGKLKKANLFLLIGLFVLIVAIFLSRFADQKEHTQPVFSTIMRLNYWQETLGIIKAHPFVGCGPGNFNLKLSRYAHNSYLQIWAQMGIFGLVSFIWIIVVVFKSCFRNLKEAFYPKQIAALLAASSVFLIHNFLDFTFFLPEVVFIWWVILGLAMVKKEKLL